MTVTAPTTSRETSILACYQGQGPDTPVGQGRIVRGVGLPYDLSDDRPGYDADTDEAGHFKEQPYDATEYAPGFFKDFLTSPDRDRVAYLWSHGFDGLVWTPMGRAITAYPIGSITKLEDGPEALRFEGLLAETPEGERVQALLRDGAQIENSVTVRIREVRYEVRGTGDAAQIIRVAEAGDLIDISHVVFGQFEDRAGIEEVLCQGCTSRRPPAATSSAVTPLGVRLRAIEGLGRGLTGQLLRHLDELATNVGTELLARDRQRIAITMLEIRTALLAVGENAAALDELVSSEPTDGQDSHGQTEQPERTRRLRLLELENRNEE